MGRWIWGIMALACVGCGVKSEEVDQRLQPVDEKIELIQDEQQGLDQRLAVVEASVKNLHTQVGTLAQPPEPAGRARRGAGSVRVRKPVASESLRMPDGTVIPPPIIIPSPVGRSGAPLVPPSPVSAPVPTPAPVAASSGASVTTTPTGSVPVVQPPALTTGTLAVNGMNAQRTTAAKAPGVLDGMNKTSGVGTVNAPQTSVVAPVPSAAQAVSVVASDRSAYQNALKTYERRQFGEAEKAFDAFMRQYPHSSLMPNALYWKGECLYSRGNYADAIFVFKDVFSRYAKHGKAPDALLKVSMAYKRLGDKENAALYYRILSEDYPTSPAVKRGKELGLSA